MYPLGDLPGLAAEPMREVEIERLEARLRAEWSTMMTLDLRDVDRLLAEVRWLQRRLRLVEDALQPLADGVRYALLDRG